MKKYLLAFIVLAVFCGCQSVPASEHAELQERYGMLQKVNKRLAGENKGLRTQNRILVHRSESQLARLDAAHDLIRELNEQKPPEAPQGGWETNPETGGIVLEGEILFAPGLSNLTPEGKATLARLAALLNSENYRQYLVRVDGHTDDVPVTKTIKINKDNWFLSARRAHAVLVELKRRDLSPGRLFLAAYGGNQPLVPNRHGRVGTPANRRVEIVLVEEAKTEK